MTSPYVLASLDDLGIDHRTGFWGAEPERGDGGQLVQVVRNGDIRPIGVVSAMTCPVRRFSAREVRDSELRKGDVLVTTSGEPGKSAYWSGPQGFAASNFVRRLRAPDATIGKYVFYFLRSQPSKESFARHSRGVAIKNLSRQFWDELRVPVRGVRDIAETVAAIESFFTLLDDAVANLERVQAKLKAYRASVLKAALEGRLVQTEASLALAEKRTYESADLLLARVLSERRRLWEEAELAKLKAAGKMPKDDKWKAKYEEPVAPDASRLPSLPEGWCWTSLSALIVDGPQNGIYMPKSQYGEGTPILRIDDYQVDWSRSATELQRVMLPVEDEARYGLSVGDLVLNRVNSPSHLGKTLAVESRHLPAVFESNMMRFTPASAVSPRFLHFYLSSAQGKQRLTAGAKWAVNQASINQQDVGNTAVPMPPEPEQIRIVAEIERLLSAATATAATVEQDAKRTVRLRQAVLKWAFEGKLVDQDPTDEPAENLLARIRAERVAVAAAKKSGARRARGKA